MKYGKRQVYIDGWEIVNSTNQDDDASSNGLNKNDPNALMIGRKTKNISSRSLVRIIANDSYKPMVI